MLRAVKYFNCLSEQAGLDWSRATNWCHERSELPLRHLWWQDIYLVGILDVPSLSFFSVEHTIRLQFVTTRAIEMRAGIHMAIVMNIFMESFRCHRKEPLIPYGFLAFHVVGDALMNFKTPFFATTVCPIALHSLPYRISILTEELVMIQVVFLDVLDIIFAQMGVHKQLPTSIITDFCHHSAVFCRLSQGTVQLFFVNLPRQLFLDKGFKEPIKPT